MNTIKTLIEVCKDKILDVSGIGRKDLNQKDYEYLCFLIEEKTNIKLSVSTLKRIWKNEYDRLPQDATLDAMTQFIGYENWNDFKREKLKENGSKAKSQKKVSSKKILKKRSVLLFFLLPLCIILTTFFIIQFNKKDSYKKMNTEDVIFRSYGTIESGVPNTVVFEYNIDKVDADSFFIQLSWDKNSRTRIYKNNYFLTALYFYPDYHVAKLIANNKVIKEHDVYVNTDGWLPYVTYGYFNDRPIYLEAEPLVRNNALSVNLQDLQKYKIDLDKDWIVHFRNTGAFKSISSDNFTLKTKVRINNEIFHLCPFFILMINCRDDSFEFPLVKKGCENTAQIKLCEFNITGKQNDMSFIGCDLEIWQELIIKNVEKNVTIFLNDKKIFLNSYNKPGGVIAGFDFFFNSLCEIDYVLLFDKDNQLIYEDRFDNAE